MTDLKNHYIHWKRIESINILNNLQTHSNLTYMYIYNRKGGIPQVINRQTR